MARRVFDAHGKVLAGFTDNYESRALFAQMISGLGANGEYEVFDEDINQFIVGDISQATQS